MNQLNTFQTISVVGIIFSAIVQVTLIFIGKHVDTVWALYPTWICVFILGSLLKKYAKEEDHHHSH